MLIIDVTFTSCSGVEGDIRVALEGNIGSF